MTTIAELYALTGGFQAVSEAIKQRAACPGRREIVLRMPALTGSLCVPSPRAPRRLA
jgi:hypothetical protein